MAAQNLLRVRGSAEGHSVGAIELFFDLVFVFAVTQLSHNLLHHPTWGGALTTFILFAAMWSIWVYTTWCTNWVSPHRVPVRLMLFAVMLAGLFMSSSIPEAFGTRGWAFGIAVAAIQVGRSLFMLWALKSCSPNNYRNYLRITSWLCVSGALWVTGGFADPAARIGIWAAAILIEIGGPFVGYMVPGLGRSTTRDWDVAGEHMAERCGLFVIIALGEMIMITGATFAGLEWAADNTIIFVGATLGSIAMWWLYFNIGAERGLHAIAHSDDPGALARQAYTIFHIPIVAGIVLNAVATELVMAHPHAMADPPVTITSIGACVIYLCGNILFKRATVGLWPVSHLGGLAALAVTAALWQQMDALMMGTVTSAIMILVAIWETISLRAASEEIERERVKLKDHS